MILELTQIHSVKINKNFSTEYKIKFKPIPKKGL